MRKAIVYQVVSVVDIPMFKDLNTLQANEILVMIY